MALGMGKQQQVEEKKQVGGMFLPNTWHAPVGPKKNVVAIRLACSAVPICFVKEGRYQRARGMEHKLKVNLVAGLTR